MLQVMGGSEAIHVGEPLSRMEVYSEFSGRKPVKSVEAPSKLRESSTSFDWLTCRSSRSLLP